MNCLYMTWEKYIRSFLQTFDRTLSFILESIEFAGFKEKTVGSQFVYLWRYLNFLQKSVR